MNLMYAAAKQTLISASSPTICGQTSNRLSAKPPYFSGGVVGKRSQSVRLCQLSLPTGRIGGGPPGAA